MKCNGWIEKACAFLGLLVIGTVVCAQPKGKDKEKFNVVFFLVDDLGWRDVGFNGSDFYETPVLDSLAAKSVRFTDAYAACHVCSPSRASILTGKYPARVQLSDYLPGRKDYPFQQLKNVATKQFLPFEEVTLAEMLRDNGYRTAIFGKWHLGEDANSSNPLQHGFQERMFEWNKGWPSRAYFPPYNLPGFKDGPEGEYLTDRLTTEAIHYIERNKDHPFFLFVSHFAVHDPIQGRPDLVAKYKNKLAAMERPDSPDFILEGNPADPDAPSQAELRALLKDERYAGYSLLPNRTVKIKQHQDNIAFAAMVESMDESMGRIIAKLKELDLDEKTIIIFVSDNGGMSAANFGRPVRIIDPAKIDEAFSTSNLPLRGGKGWLYEGGIRVPMLINWPHYGKKGLVTTVPVVTTDFYPTILDMLGLPLHPEQHKDGVSLVPLLKGKQKIARGPLYWHFPHYSNHGLQSPGGAIRSGNYKLLEYFENNTVQLFNLAEDLGEQHDISASHPRIVAELRNNLRDWRAAVGAKMMVPNPRYSADSLAAPHLSKKIVRE